MEQVKPIVIFNKESFEYFTAGEVKEETIIPVNASSYLDAITITNGKGSDLRVLGFSLKFKAGLETCTLQLLNETVEVFSGDSQIGHIGNKIDSVVPLDVIPVDFIFSKGSMLKVKIKTKSQAVVYGDISIVLFCKIVK